MNNHFETIQSYLLDLEYNIIHQDAELGVFVIEQEDMGIRNLFIACASPILIIEQFLFELKSGSEEIYKNLLMKNRDIVHGAFVLDEEGTKVIFRDTLQLENIDPNELEGSINSLSLLLSEYSNELITFSKH
jgi:hypothetical protein